MVVPKGQASAPSVTSVGKWREYPAPFLAVALVRATHLAHEATEFCVGDVAVASPPRQPIFQEADPELSGLSFTFAVRSEHLHSTLFRLTTIIQTPGYCATEKWVMICEGGMLTLYDPSHPKTRTA
jgi:hypothetical protein